MLTETQLWQRLGLVEAQQGIHRLYTPAMLADLLGVPVAVIRRWHRRGLIVPAREVRRLPYFDFQEVATARRLADLLAAGVSPQAIEKQLEAISRCLPGVGRPLAQLSVIVRGKEILLRQGDGLVEPGGQFRFDFDAWEGPPTHEQAVPSSAEQMCRMAAELEEDGQLAAAADMYRAAMAAIGPKAEICFQVAELLYRSGDLGEPANATTWPSTSTRTTSRPAQTWAAFWPKPDSTTWPWPPSRAIAMCSPSLPTSIIILPARWMK